MIEKRVFVDRMEILQDGQIQVRTATQFFENNEAISEKSYHRHVIAPGDDVSSEEQIVKDVVSGNLHTQTRIDKYKLNKLRRVVNQA